jgi:predicted amidohydrolase
MRSVQRRKIPVAAIQTPAHDRSAFASAWPRILASVEAAGARGARLIVLPEATVPGYVLGTEAVAEELLAAAARDLGALARRHGATIVYGTAKILDGATYNAAVAIGPDGREIGFAAKQFLWHFDRLWFAPGTALQPVETPVGKLGLLVCADGRIPSIAATLVDRGAEALVMPTAWVTSGRDPQALENLQADLMVSVRARENGVPFVAANKWGVELGSVAYCGKSMLVDAGGRTIARAAQDRDEIVFGEVEIGASDVTRAPDDDPGAEGARPTPPDRARIAFTSAVDPHETETLRGLARQADASGPFGRAELASGGIFEVGGVRIAAIVPEAFWSPRGLVAARLGGIDAFACIPGGDAAWHVPYARTRAAELRAYVIVFSDELRAFAVDPDGAVVAGTFDDYRMATFAYERARSAATDVAPSTNVLKGTRTAEAIRRRGVP